MSESCEVSEGYETAIVAALTHELAELTELIRPTKRWPYVHAVNMLKPPNTFTDVVAEIPDIVNSHNAVQVGDILNVRLPTHTVLYAVRDGMVLSKSLKQCVITEVERGYLRTLTDRVIVHRHPDGNDNVYYGSAELYNLEKEPRYHINVQNPKMRDLLLGPPTGKILWRWDYFVYENYFIMVSDNRTDYLRECIQTGTKYVGISTLPWGNYNSDLLSTLESYNIPSTNVFLI